MVRSGGTKTFMSKPLFDHTSLLYVQTPRLNESDMRTIPMLAEFKPMPDPSITLLTENPTYRI